MKNATSRATRVALSSSDSGNTKNCSISDPAVSAQAAPPNLITVFKERCEARALMVAEGMLDLQEAVDGLQEIALKQGLVQYHGPDAIQQIMSDAFKPGRRQ